MSNTNDNFAWDNEKVPENFFDDSPEDLEKVDKASEEGDDFDVDNKPEDKPEEDDIKKTDEERADEFFDDEDEEEDDEASDNPSATKDKGETTDKDKGVDSTKSALKFLHEKGLIDLEEDEEFDDEQAEDILEDKWDEAIDSRIGELLEGLPSEVKNLIKYAKNGGDVASFFMAMAKGSQSGISENMDITEEANQEAIMRAVLAEEEYDEEDIEAQIELLKDSGRLESIATKRFNSWKRANKEQNEKIAQAQAERERSLKKQARQARAELSETLNSMEDVGGLKLSRQDKKELPAYFHDRSVKLQNGSTISTFHKDMYEAMANETAAIQLAKLLRTRKKDGTFDFSAVERQAATKVAKEVKNNIRRNKDNTPTKSAGRSSYNSIADFFN